MTFVRRLASVASLMILFAGTMAAANNSGSGRAEVERVTRTPEQEANDADFATKRSRLTSLAKEVAAITDPSVAPEDKEKIRACLARLATLIERERDRLSATDRTLRSAAMDRAIQIGQNPVLACQWLSKRDGAVTIPPPRGEAKQPAVYTPWIPTSLDDLKGWVPPIIEVIGPYVPEPITVPPAAPITASDN